jgi:hydrogenase maturation protease
LIQDGLWSVAVSEASNSTGMRAETLDFQYPIHNLDLPAAMSPNKPSPLKPLLVIGYGNTLRGDDGVGPKVAAAIESMRLPGVSTLSADLLTPELAEPVSQSARVIFVDAQVDAPGRVQLRPLEPAQSSQLLAHAASPQTVLALARDVFGHIPRAWWLTVPASDLGIGESLSPVAERGMSEAILQIKALASD